MPRIRLRYLVIAAACLAVAGAGSWFWSQMENGDLPTSTPSCSWPLRIHGQPSAGEAGLVRCYLQALARRDLADLSSVAWYGKAAKADLAHSADARTGVATAKFTPNAVDGADTSLTITYADGARDDNLEIHEENPSVLNSWRLIFG